MKILAQFLLILSGFNAVCQEYNELHITEVDIDLLDGSIMVFSILGNPLNGYYKLNNYSKGDYTIATFIDGKVHGISKNYIQDKLVGLNRYTNGLENGECLGYDEEGNIYIRINMKDGKMHGLVWHRDSGEKYYLMDKEVTMDVYNEYLAKQQKN
ncbi:MAG: hypothetical protein RLQ12_04320 [Cyclobacteriaceae bacterium]